MALPFRETRSSCIHQNTGTSPPQEETSQGIVQPISCPYTQPPPSFHFHTPSKYSLCPKSTQGQAPDNHCCIPQPTNIIPTANPELFPLACSSHRKPNKCSGLCFLPTASGLSLAFPHAALHCVVWPFVLKIVRSFLFSPQWLDPSVSSLSPSVK